MRVSEWTCWQLIDSAFPSGGFAHSGGLEAARGFGLSAAELSGLLRTALLAAARASGPFITALHRQPDCFVELDVRCDSTLLGHVANRASRRQGLALLRAAVSAFGGEELHRVSRLCRDGATPGHYAVVFALVCYELGVPLPRAHEMFIYTVARSQLSAATRLGVLGPLEAQSMQHQLAGDAAEAARLSSSLSLSDVAQPAPLLELLQGAHERLYSRLFQS